jgi:hypothetical protein
MGAPMLVNGPKTIARIRAEGREPLVKEPPSYGDNDNRPRFDIDQNIKPPFPFVGGKPLEMPRWLIKGVLPEVGVAVLGGQFSSGKTLIGLDISLSLIYGGPFLGRKVSVAVRFGSRGRVKAKSDHDYLRRGESALATIPIASSRFSFRRQHRLETSMSF